MCRSLKETVFCPSLIQLKICFSNRCLRRQSLNEVLNYQLQKCVLTASAVRWFCTINYLNPDLFLLTEYQPSSYLYRGRR